VRARGSLKVEVYPYLSISKNAELIVECTAKGSPVLTNKGRQAKSQKSWNSIESFLKNTKDTGDGLNSGKDGELKAET